MNRNVGITLLAAGGLLEAVGFVGLVLTLTRPGGKAGLAVFIPLLVVGFILMVTGVIQLARRHARRPDGNGSSDRYSPNQPVTRTLNDGTYTTLYQPPVKGKHARPSALRVSVPAAGLPDLKVAVETGFDRFAKRVGLATEVQTGDPDFDAACYITTDAADFAADYFADAVKRFAVMDLRRAGFTELTVKHGTLTAVWTGFDPTVHDSPELEEVTAARLKVLTLDLPETPVQPVRRGRPFWTVVLWLLLVSYAATFFTLFAHKPVRGWELALWAGGVVAFVGPLFAVVAVLLLRGTSSSHHNWIGLMIGGLVLIPLGSAGSVSLTNAALDTSPEVVHRAVIVGKNTRRQKNKTTYRVQCQSWRTDAETEEFSVSQGEYDRVKLHESRMVVTTRAGRWGIEWIRQKKLESK